MNRIITILVTIFILLLLYIWISHVWGSDKPKHPRQIVDAREGDALGADDTSADMDTSLMSDDMVAEDPLAMHEDDQNETQTTTENNTVEVNKEPVKEIATEPKKVTPPVTETKVETKPAAKLPAPTATKTSQPITKPKTVAASADGKHLVIVGNFLQAVNAQQRLEELKKAGFNNVEIVNFDLSEYHTVCAGRFDDVNEARRLVKKLKDYHKIDAYVRIGS